MTNPIELLANAARDYWLAEGYDPSEPNEGMARALLAALDVAGLRIVPKEPTEEMIEAGDEAMDWDSDDSTGNYYVRYHDGDSLKSYRAMLAAIPKD